MSRIPRFTAIPPEDNRTIWGQAHIDLARLLHDEAFGGYWERLGRTTLFPVGRGGVSIFPKGGIVPPLAPRTPATSTPNVPPPIDRRDVPQNQTELPSGVTFGHWRNVGGRWAIRHPSVKGDDGQYGTDSTGWTDSGMRSLSESLGIPTAREAGYVDPTPNVAMPPQQTNTGGSMDLGSLFGDLATTYIQTRYAQPTASPTNTQIPVDTFGLDLPFVDVIPDNPGSACGDNMVYKKVCGQYKWVKQRKRRRKRLATASDIKDLTALKGVLGSGQALQSWIATHS